MTLVPAWNRVVAVVVALFALACGPSDETLRFLADRTFEGPSLDLSKPGTTEWVCNYHGRHFAPFNAELVFQIDASPPGMEHFLGDDLPLRATVNCLARSTAGDEAPLTGLDLRPFDPPRRYSTDGAEGVIAGFKAGGPGSIVIRFVVTDPDPEMAQWNPRLRLRAEHLAH